MSLRNIIEQQLPLSVHDYMQLCLQHPEYGYYRKAQAVGAQGDFVTAPEVSQIFGDLVGLWMRDIWQQMGEGEFHLVELGPGRGTLSADVKRMLPQGSLHLVESNTTLREAQREQLWKYEPQWHDKVESLPQDKPLLILANEFFDAFPIRQWVGQEERIVAPGFVFAPEGDVTREECPQAKAVLAVLCERLKAQGGALLMADYGYGNGEAGDTLQAIKDHAFHSPLEDCGEADLTAHVDFAALSEVAKAAGCQASPMVTQEKFLRSLGGDIWLQKLLQKAETAQQRKDIEEGWLRLISPAQMGSLFKVMAITADNTLNPAGFA